MVRAATRDAVVAAIGNTDVDNVARWQPLAAHDEIRGQGEELRNTDQLIGRQ